MITSPSGAAVRDVLSVLRRRFPAVPVIIYPAAVQGDAAPGELMSALSKAIRRDECDVLIMGRGGGSLEDLWAFNDEQLARAIVDCPIPIISAVGHEIDFTIADFVADVRAPTPSGAAEIVVPDQHDWLRQIATIATRIARIGQRALDDRAQEIDWLTKRLLAGSPAATLQRQHASLRELNGRLQSTIRQQLSDRRSALQHANGALLRMSPALSVQRSIGRLESLRQRLSTSTRNALADANHRLALLGRALNSVSPLATLDRGYAIVKSEDSGKVLMAVADVSPGEDIRAHLAHGELIATVKEILPDE
jgi:exodeoxyribonuclease VII large subunit